MRRYIYIAAGGIVGAAARFSLKDFSLPGIHTDLPLGTIVVNITGSFLITLILTIVFRPSRKAEDARIGITSGFLGAFTTFSSLCRELAGLLEQSLYKGFAYAVISVAFGLIAASAGLKLANAINRLENVDYEGSRILRTEQLEEDEL